LHTSLFKLGGVGLRLLFLQAADVIGGLCLRSDLLKLVDLLLELGKAAAEIAGGFAGWFNIYLPPRRRTIFFAVRVGIAPVFFIAGLDIFNVAFPFALLGAGFDGFILRWVFGNRVFLVSEGFFLVSHDLLRSRYWGDKPG